MSWSAVTASTSATGRFTKKIIRQSANSVSSPPARTPIAAPAPPTAPQAASAFAFACPWKQEHEQERRVPPARRSVAGSEMNGLTAALLAMHEVPPDKLDGVV